MIPLSTYPQSEPYADANAAKVFWPLTDKVCRRYETMITLLFRFLLGLPLTAMIVALVQMGPAGRFITGFMVGFITYQIAYYLIGSV